MPGEAGASTWPAAKLADVLERDFLTHRAAVLELAAFLDRCDRSPVAESQAEDPRLSALRQALELLQDGGGQRVIRILQYWSDPEKTPRSALPPESVRGVYDPTPPADASA